MMSVRLLTGDPGPSHDRYFVQVGLELVEHDLELAGVECAERRNVGRIDDDGAALLHVGDCRLGQAIGHRAVAEQLVAHHADPRALQPVGIERACVVARRMGRGFRRGRIVCIRLRRCTPSMAAASATVRAIGPAVSWLCEIGTMPVRLTSPTVGLMPDERVALRAGQTIEPSVSVPMAAAARFAATAAPDPELEPRRVAIERVGILRLPAAPAPAAGRVRRPEVRPLAQVRLAEDHRAGGAQPRRPRTHRAAPATPSSASDPAVVFMRSAVAMLSLIRIGMPCSGPRGPGALRSASSSSAIGERVRIELDHAAAAPGVEFGGDLVEPAGAVERQVGAFGEVLAQQAVGVLVGAALPGAVWVAEVDRQPGGFGDLGVQGHFAALVPGQGAAQDLGDLGDLGRHRVGQGGRGAITG